MDEYKVLLIEDYDNPNTIYDAIVIKETDEEDVLKLLAACDSSSEEANEYYDCEYRGFFRYLEKRYIWYKRASIAEYRY